MEPTITLTEPCTICGWTGPTIQYVGVEKRPIRHPEDIPQHYTQQTDPRAEFAEEMPPFGPETKIYDDEQSHKILEHLLQNPKNEEEVTQYLATQYEQNQETIEEENDATVTQDEYNTLLEYIPQPDQWFITKPGDKTLPHLINFYEKGNLIALIPLNEENINALVPILEQYYQKPTSTENLPLYKKAINAWKRHKILGSLGILILLILTGNLITNLVVNGIF